MNPTLLMQFLLYNSFICYSCLSFPQNLKALYLISRLFFFFLEEKEVTVDSVKTRTSIYAFSPSFQVQHPDVFCALGFAVSVTAPGKFSLPVSFLQQAGDLLG